MALYIGLPDRGAIGLFEPWNIFDSVLKPRDTRKTRTVQAGRPCPARSPE
ncbi:MAG TPA: hypothetical protein VNE39_27040 [Planctomycetota bacterium]|nr:hypothetical protein [Planctomycetota bacterium]